MSAGILPALGPQASCLFVLILIMNEMLKVVIVVGARPNFMKVAPIIKAIGAYNREQQPGSAVLQHILVHTGQHYDFSMSDQFFRDLDLPAPDSYLGIGSGSHADQTARVMQAFEEVLKEHKPDLVLVVGDVNSTLACALVTSKFTFEREGGIHRPLTGHVEAGLRSFDRTMPEEVNRLVTDHVCDLLFVTERSGLENLKKEGIADSKVFFVGNTMIDTLLASRQLSTASRILARLGLENTNGHSSKTEYVLLTLHRPSNVDSSASLAEILDAVAEIGWSWPVVFPVHPRTRARLDSIWQNDCATGNGVGTPGIHVIEPLGYLDFLALMANSRAVLTDSGGIQEETTCLGVPCVTLRENTERPVTIESGTNALGGCTKASILRVFQEQMQRPTENCVLPQLWDGHAAERIVNVVVSTLGRQSTYLR